MARNLNIQQQKITFTGKAQLTAIQTAVIKKPNHSVNGDFKFQFKLDLYGEKKLPPHLFAQPALSLSL